MTQLNSQWMLLSCTQRLLEIQRQLQQHNNRRQLQQQGKYGKGSSSLSQQLISSVVMKQQAHRQLSQQQNLLIHYLQQQLHQLSTTNTHQHQHLPASVNMLEQACLQLQKCKLQQQQSRQRMLQKTKREYRQLQQLLPVLTTQSTANYELVLRLRERNQVTRMLLQEKGVTREEMQQEYNQMKIINNSNKHQLQQLQSYISDTTPTTAQLSLTLTNQSSQLQTTSQKLYYLQQEIRRYQLSNKKFRHVKEVAVGDNFKLRQQLMRNVEMVRRKEEVMGQYGRQREVRMLENQSMGSNLERLIAESRMLKQRFNSITQSNLQSLQTLSQLQAHINQHTTQLSTMHNSLSKLKHLKTLALSQCYSKQQELQKQFYFIQQYINVNSQLIGQIQIVIEQGQRKKWLRQKFTTGNNYSSNITSESLFIERLRGMLVKAKEQLSSIHSSYSNIVQRFRGYQIHPQ